jgi:hypothetical protein
MVFGSGMWQNQPELYRLKYASPPWGQLVLQTV